MNGSADVDLHGDCLDNFTEESGCKGDMNEGLSKRKGRLILTKQHSDAILRHLELDYKLFMNEIEHIANKQKCLDVNLKVAGCYLCDNRLKPMLNVPVQSNLQLKNYISFSPPSVFGPGHFTYNRMWNGKYNFLPSGEAQARSRTEKLLQRINKNDNKIARGEGGWWKMGKMVALLVQHLFKGRRRSILLRAMVLIIMIRETRSSKTNVSPVIINHLWSTNLLRP